jgi:hypothetical protein
MAVKAEAVSDKSGYTMHSRMVIIRGSFSPRLSRIGRGGQV